MDLDYTERAGFLVGRSAAIAEWRHKKEKREGDRLISKAYMIQWNARPDIKAMKLAHSRKPSSKAKARARYKRWLEANREHRRSYAARARAEKRKSG